MFDSKEIAKQARIRAKAIMEDNRRRRRQVEAAGMILSTCAVVLVCVTVIIPMMGPAGDTYINIDEEDPPFAALLLPDTNAVPYDEIKTREIPNVSIPFYDEVNVSADSRELKMILLNPEDNQYRFVYEIELDDSGETLYKSGLVQPGMMIENPKMSTELESGDYRAILKIRFYELTNLKPMNGADVRITLSVE